MEVSVLLITFNRPDTTQKVFDAIKEAKPKDLFIFNDGPRAANDQDIKAREKIKAIINQVDWKCDLHTNFPDRNMGCGFGVTSAISWAFEYVDTLIILEDDCVPLQSFFKFCEYCLDKYYSSKRVMQISGNNYTEDNNFTTDDYLFSKFGHIWGWATWKRAWEEFDFDMKEWPEFKKNGYLNMIFKSQKEREYYSRLFDLYYENRTKPWGYRWMFAKIKNEGLSIIPKYNLIHNIGLGGTHNKRKVNYRINLQDDFIVSNEPTFIVCNNLYDNYHFKNHINRKKITKKRVRKFLLKVIGKNA